MKLTAREKNFIIAAVTLLICTFLAVYLVLPLRDRYMDNKRALRETADRLEQLTAEKKARKATVEDLAELNIQLTDYKKQLPDEIQSAELLYYLNQAAEKSGVVLEKFEHPGILGSDFKVINAKQENSTSSSDNPDTKLPKGIGSISFQLRVMGNYNQVKGFLTKTEELKRIVHIKAITINDIKNREDMEGLECLIDFDAFVKQNDKKSGQPGSKEDTGRPSDIPGTAAGRDTLFEH